MSESGVDSSAQPGTGPRTANPPGVSARTFWLTGPRQPVLSQETLPVEASQVVVRAQASGISKGTERLVFDGNVPASEYERMRAPLQRGHFPFPVQYGYALVGTIERPAADGTGPAPGQRVFALAPHGDRLPLPTGMAVPVPKAVPSARAILAANMETALTILWDSAVGPGDRVAVIGAGVIGALTAYLAGQIPGTTVTLVDINPDRAALAEALGCRFAGPGEAPSQCDTVIHASASAAGLETALNAAGLEARVVEASWYGADTVPAPLGGAFHSQRLRLIASQVGRVPAERQPRWSHRRRLETALALLADHRLEALITGETAFDDLPRRYGAVLSDPDTLAHRVVYS